MWYLGFPDQALKRARGGPALARNSPYSLSQAAASEFEVLIHAQRGEAILSLEMAQAQRRFCAERGVIGYLASAACSEGLALAMLGQTSEGIARNREGMRDFFAIGTKAGQTGMQCGLAYSYLLAGEAAPGLEAVDAGLRAVKETGERNTEADLDSVRGELILLRDRPPTDEAERCFRKAIEVARSQHAKSYELRATTRLARLLDRRGQREQARELLSEIYNWFTEGFDTADLKDAKALLGELSTEAGLSRLGARLRTVPPGGNR